MWEFIVEHWIISSIIGYFVIMLPVCYLLGGGIRFGMNRDMKTGEDLD